MWKLGTMVPLLEQQTHNQVLVKVLSSIPFDAIDTGVKAQH